MVRKYVRAARDAGILDWVFLAIGILTIGLGVAYAGPQRETDARNVPADARTAGDAGDRPYDPDRTR